MTQLTIAEVETLRDADAQQTGRFVHELATQLAAALAREAKLKYEREQILSDSMIPSEKRAEYEMLAARAKQGWSGWSEAAEAILALCKANDRLALLVQEYRAALDATE